jgi:adenylate cyclase
MAFASGIISFDTVDRLFLPPAPRSSRTYAEFRSSLGAHGPMLDELVTLLGFAQPRADQRLPSDDEEMLAGFLRVWGDRPEDAWRAARMISDGMSRMTFGWTRLFFERYVTEPLERGLTPTEARAQNSEVGVAMAQLGLRMAVWLEQRYLAQALETLNAEYIQGQLAAAGLMPPSEQDDPAVMFADLAGFVALTEHKGDRAATQTAELVRDRAQRSAAANGGRLVKTLGDGAMLVFPNASGACAAARTMVDGWPAELPPLHVGIAVGAALEHDGDYFGATVNLASRLSAAAGENEVLVARQDGGALALEPAESVGPMELKGVSRPPQVYRLLPAAED